jgi:hypothetical protein
MKPSPARQAKPQSIVKQRYESTAPGTLGSITFEGALDDEVAWELFAVQVSVLDDMADDGLLSIVGRHEESETGDRNIDRVDFRRLAVASDASHQNLAIASSE